MAYTPTNWQCGDVVTAEALNKIEQGIASASGGSGGGESTLVNIPSTSTCTLVLTDNYQNDAAVTLAAGECKTVVLTRYSGDNVPTDRTVEFAVKKIEIIPTSTYADIVLAGFDANAHTVTLKNLGSASITIAVNSIVMSVLATFSEGIPHREYCLVEGTGCVQPSPED